LKKKGVGARLADVGLMCLSLALCALAVEGGAYVIMASGSEGYYERDFTNGLGLRDPREPRALAGEPVVLTIGDSFTYGLGVPYADSYPAQLEQQLRQKNHDVAVINAGVPGIDTGGALEVLERVHSAYRPRVVILGFHPADVVQNQQKLAARRADQKNSSTAAEHASADLADSVEREEKNSPKLYLLREFLRQKTSTFALLDYLYKTYFIEYLPAPAALTNTGTGAEFDATEHFLDEIHAFLVANGDAELVILSMAALVRFDDYPYRNLNARLEAYARSRDVHFIDSLSTLSQRPSREFWVSIRDGHYNAAGNALIGTATSDYLLEQRLLEASPPEAAPTISSIGTGVTVIPPAIAR
jgi:acyl-CoA thioesterase-1